MFISILYMFRAFKCPSSGYSIVSIRYLVYVTLCRWPSGMQVPAYQTVTYIEWHIPDNVSIQLNILMMNTWMLETCRELKQTDTKKNCASSWSLNRITPSCIYIVLYQTVCTASAATYCYCNFQLIKPSTFTSLHFNSLTALNGREESFLLNQLF